MSPQDEFVAKIDYTVDRAQQALLALQKPEGYWHAPLEANAEMNAEFIIFNHFMDTVDVETEARLKKYLLDTQSADARLVDSYREVLAELPVAEIAPRRELEDRESRDGVVWQVEAR